MHSIKLKIGVNNTLRNTIFQISVNVPLRWLLGLRKLSSIIRKHYFLLWTKEAAFFPYFYHGIIIYVAELFDCAVNFKFYLNIFIFLNHKHKSNIKGTIFELRSSHLFRDQLYKEVWEVKCQAFNFTGVLSFTSVFEDFGHIFSTCFLQNFS